MQAWPHGNVWRDNNLWEKGHWVNNKFGACTVAALILELSHRCNISLNMVDASTLDQSVGGMVINRPLSAIDIINSLRIAYFFDIVVSYREYIRFTKRGSANSSNISSKILIKLPNNSYLEQIEIPQTNIISKLDLHFIDHHNNYIDGFCRVDTENLSNKATPVLKLPIVMSYLEAERLGWLILKNATTETKILKFIIPSSCIQNQVGDFIILHYLNYQYQIRIIYMKLLRLTVEIHGIIDDLETYYLPVVK
ncbi:MAG: phage tail protein [Candidatus Rickettsia vulgarisii]